MKTKMTFALMAILTSSAFAAFQAPLPEFKNEKQLAEWRAEMAAKDTPQTTTEDTAFYTGKPYVESSGSYAFKYRSYNPDLARWTSEDPSGFPDGANGSIYAPTPTSEVDWLGLATIDLSGSTENDIIGINVTMKVDKKPTQIGNVVAAETNVTFTAPGKSGWIVQHITNDWSNVFNDSDNSKYTPKRTPTPSYWEAWAVVNGKVTSGGVDNWNTMGFPDTTHGEYIMSGKFGFYTSENVAGSSPQSWGFQAPDSGLAFSIITKPTWWNENGYERKLTMKWE